MPQVLRSDARDNRDRVLLVARELFAERGLDVTMREVARRAEVGPATLYRRFPTKVDLVEAAFADEARLCETIVDDGCADSDPWRGFCSVIEGLSVLNGRNQGFMDAFTLANSEPAGYADRRRAALRALAALGRRAQAAGALRRDFTIDDLVLVLLAGRALGSLPQAKREAATRRFAALAIDAFRA
ncbi:helix-turn-helix transcriptional regulator [Mycobacterium yunnanensis]|uniref:Helix-turn-helix transcriptional regulator n=1 Tax=Mycobacterium yunnanensis TaxID=368477 RepID=A0A9X2Z012_9MYCO|nr:helix-turn-helix domain-containing protein [Mycobacterium yunnanensis]MCV7420489.1 helix-turn-helix transcriptional regulator [Mycobacterium yunnanensis]